MFAGGGLGLRKQGAAGPDDDGRRQHRRDRGDGGQFHPVGEFLMVRTQTIPP